MLFLVGAILSSVMIAVVMKAGRPHIRSNSLVLSVNYIICLALSLVFVLKDNGTADFSLFPGVQGLAFAIILGIISGFLYVETYTLLQWNLTRNGAVLSETFMKLGVLVPTVLAITWFHETPGVAQVIGLVLAVAAILLINLEKRPEDAGQGGGRSAKPGLVVLLLSGGICDGLSKVFEVYGNSALASHYLLYLFAAAFLFCSVRMLIRREKPGRWDVLYGVLIGVPNYFSARFLLEALSSVKAVIAYPTYSVGSILLVMAFGLFLFRERLTRRQYVAIGIILAALVLLNI